MGATKLGVIGLGLIWEKEHEPLLREMDEAFELVAFCDTDESRRAEIERTYGDAPFVTDYHELLTMDAVEAVLVLTPIDLNAPVARDALEAGKDVIMEKPMARSVAEARALMESVARSGRRLFITEQASYTAWPDQVRELIEAGAIGELVLWDRVQHMRNVPTEDDDSYESADWRQEADFPLGTLFDGGKHHVAELAKLFGTPSSVFARGQRLRPGFGEFDHIAMLFHYENELAHNVVGTFSQASYLPGSRNYLHIRGTQGIILLTDDGLLVEDENGNARTVERPHHNERRVMWSAIADALRNGGEPFHTLQRELEQIATLEAIDRSLHRGAEISIKPKPNSESL